MKQIASTGDISLGIRAGRFLAHTDGLAAGVEASASPNPEQRLPLMSLAKVPDSTPTLATRAVSMRRTLFSGAVAVAIGSGITAGAAASIADLAPTDPDAALIALCAEIVAFEHAWWEIYGGPDAIVGPVAVGAEGRALQAAAATHHLYYPLSHEDEKRNPTWLTLKGLAGDPYHPVRASV